MMKKLREKYGMSMLMITHDLGIVADICDEVSIIYAGQVVEHGTLDDVYRHTLHPYTKGPVSYTHLDVYKRQLQM